MNSQTGEIRREDDPLFNKRTHNVPLTETMTEKLLKVEPSLRPLEYAWTKFLEQSPGLTGSDEIKARRVFEKSWKIFEQMEGRG